MAQINYTPIRLYSSATPSATPSPSRLIDGELALNYHDGVLFYKDYLGNVQVLATQSGSPASIAGGSTGSVVYQSATSTTAFLSLGTSGDILIAGASAPEYASPSSLTVGKATNVAGGAAGSLPYQSAANTTAFLAAGTDGQVLTLASGVPTWATSGTATLATNLAGGTAGRIAYQSATDATSFVAAGNAGYILTANGTSAPSWANPTAVSVGLATTSANISGGTLGALPYQSASGTTTFLALGTTNNVLTAGVAGPQYVAQSTLSVGAATTATNLASGVTGSVPYQSSAGSTTFLAPGSNGYVLTMSSGVPTWASAGTATTATNLAGGSAGTLPYQSAPGTTGFLSTGTAGQFLISTGASAPSWTSGSSLSVGTSTNLSGGGAGYIPYQSASGTTAFVSAGTSGYVLTSNGTSAPTWSAASSVSLSANNTWTGTQSFTGTSSLIAEKLKNAAELLNIVGSAISGSQNIYLSDGAVTYFTGATTGNFTPVVSLSLGTNLATAMATGDAITTVILVKTSTSTSYYCTGITITGSTSTTTVWLGGTPTSGSYGTNNVDAYTFTIIKTGSTTFTVLASQNSYI